MGVVQHPFGETDLNKLYAPLFHPVHLFRCDSVRIPAVCNQETLTLQVQSTPVCGGPVPALTEFFCMQAGPQYRHCCLRGLRGPLQEP